MKQPKQRRSFSRTGDCIDERECNRYLFEVFPNLFAKYVWPLSFGASAVTVCGAEIPVPQLHWHRVVTNSGIAAAFEMLGDDLVVGGYSGASTNFGGRDFWFAQVDAAGNFTRERFYGGAGNDEAHTFLLLSDGSFLLGGTSDSPIEGNKTSTNFGSSDIWLVRVDRNGSKLWEASFGGSGTDASRPWDAPFLPEYTGNSFIQPTADGNFYVGGTSGSEPSGNKSSPHYGGDDLWLIKVDKNGVKLWDKSYGGNQRESLVRMLLTEDGGLFLCGHSSSPPSGNKTSAFYGDGIYRSGDFWVVRVDRDGNKLWDASYGGSGSERLKDVVVVENGLILAGSSTSGADGNKTSTNFSLGNLDCWIVRVSSQGELLWDRSFGGRFNDEPANLLPLKDGGFILSGDGGDPGLDFLILRLDRDGNTLWSRSAGGTQTEQLGYSQISADGRLFLAGYSGSPPSGSKTSPLYGQTDLWFVSFDLSGNRIWDYSFGITNEFRGASRFQQTADGGWLIPGYVARGDDPDRLWLVKLRPDLPKLRVSQQATNAILLTLSGPATNYVLEYTTNLISWSFLDSNTPEGASLSFTQPVDISSPGRVYRARSGKKADER